jgi:hypothetical protein
MIAMSIVDQYGKPFKPNPLAEVSERVAARYKADLLEHVKPSKFDTWFKLSELRQSCGVEPGTITFRPSRRLHEDAA